MTVRTIVFAGLTAAAALGAFVACGEDGAPADGSSSSSSSSSSGGPNDDGGGAGSADAAPDVITYGDPLEGTPKAATLVKEGFQFTEGPVWIGGRLLFSDINANTIHELQADGGTFPFRTNSNASNGLAVDPQGNLLACEGSARRVVRSLPQVGATLTPIAEENDSEPFNSPNDVIVRSDGNVYFTDPDYENTSNQDAEGVYRISNAPGNPVTRLAHTFDRPNGIALSPDQNTLYVVDNGAGKLLSAAVAAEGSVGAFTELADAPGGDGMAVDDAGNLYVTTSSGVAVFTKTGAPIGTITVPRVPANCTFGGADRRTLYITARQGLYEMKGNVPGLP